LVRSHLEYANTVWSPYKQYLIELVEKVQKRATKLVHDCKHLLYTDRLKYLKLPTLKYRRHRGDMIKTYKILHGLYDTVAPNLMMSQFSHTRGNMSKLQKMYSSMILENIFFTERIVNLWNSLPSLVVEAPSVNCFKMRLDKFWSNQDVLYNFKAPFLGTGSRSYS